MWSPTDLYFAAKHIHWGVALFMSVVVGVARDSIERDFTLLGGLIVLSVVTEFRDHLVHQRSASSRTK